MSITTDNPCIGCATNQGCCTHLGGLMLTEKEYESLFKVHEDKLHVTRSKQVVMVAMRDGGACPYWKGGGCSEYKSRPIDCRLHPYMMRHFFQGKDRVKITYHNLNDCPQRDVLVSEADAAELIAEFGKKVYGEDKIIITQCENRLVTRLGNNIESVLGHLHRTRDVHR